MTSKEKAKELIKKHVNYFGKNDDDVEDYKAKQSALITVEELLSEYNGYRIKSYLSIRQVKEITEFWCNVKQEIENYETTTTIQPNIAVKRNACRCIQSVTRKR